MRTRLSAVVATALVLAACGGTQQLPSQNTPTAADNPCVILSNGNKVCGNDAYTWCEVRQNQGVEDPQTANACAQVIVWYQQSGH